MRAAGRPGGPLWAWGRGGWRLRGIRASLRAPPRRLGPVRGGGWGGGELQHVGAEGRREEDAGPERRRRELVRPVAAGLGCLGEALGFAGGPSPGLGGQAREAVV